MKVESTKPVASPDGTNQFVVERFIPVINGVRDELSGRLNLKIVDSLGSAKRQNRVLASQIQIINPAMWVDNVWTAFSYSISKHANGMVYYNSSSGQVLQLEFVMYTRRMGSDGKIETELNGFEVREGTTEPVTIGNVTFQNRPVFPLFMTNLPAFSGKPFPKEFLDELLQAITAYKQFRIDRGISEIDVQQASESFSPDKKKVALLACIDGSASCVITPLESESSSMALTSATLTRFPGDVTVFSCEKEPEEVAVQQEAPSAAEEESAPDRFRFATKWQDGEHVIVEKEVFDMENEDDTSTRIPVYSVLTNGEIQRLAAPASTTSSKDQNSSQTKEKTAAGTATESDGPGLKKSETKQPASTASETRKEATRKAAAVKPQQATNKKENKETPSVSPSPSPTPQSRKGLLKRILPGRNKEE